MSTRHVTTSPPRVSFVVTSYNYGRFVAQTIDSLLAQTAVDLEIIVIDDASSDHSREVLLRYADESRVRLIFHKTNQGNISSYNEGLGLARGEFVGVLASDDFCLRPDAVVRQVAIFDAHPDVGFVHTAYTFVDPRNRPSASSRLSSVDTVRDGLAEFVDLLDRNYIVHSGTLVRRDCHAVVGYYDPRLRYAGDWDLWLRLAARYQVGYVAEPLYAYRTHDTSMNRTVAREREFNEARLTIEKAFDALPPTAPAEVQRLRSRALRGALLLPARRARMYGRPRQSWLYLYEALRRSPALLAAPEFHAAVARTVLLSLVGTRRYEQLAARRTAGAPA